MTSRATKPLSTESRQRQSAVRRVTAAACICFALSGCSGVEPQFAAMAAATTTTINTQKLPTDIIASLFTGKDCSTPRQSVDGGPLCRPYDQGVIEKPVYCYRSLADTTCYEEPDPYRDGAQPVN